MHDRQNVFTGKRIRSQRRDLEMTQKQLAAEINLRIGGDVALHQGTVSRWETGASEVSLRFHTPLARVLGVSKDWLFECPPEGRSAEQVAA